MYLHFRGLRAVTGVAAAAVALAALPAVGQAAWLSFRNDLKQAVIVQGVVVINNRAYPGKARLLYPGEVSQEGLIQPCTRIVSVYDAQNPKRRLYQQTIVCVGDLFFSIKTDAMGRVSFVQISAPMRPGAGRPSRQ